MASATRQPSRRVRPEATLPRQTPRSRMIRTAAATTKPAEQQAAQEDSKDPKAESNDKTNKSRAEQGQIWIKDGPLARPIKVQIGASDGIDTEISGSEVKAGMEVIVVS